MKKAIKELVGAAEEAIEWMDAATPPNELNTTLRRLETATKNVKGEEKGKIRTGYLLLIENSDGLRRITATVAAREQYMSRAGWAGIGVKADIVYSEEVNNLTWARDDLKTLLPNERWGALGMKWSDTPKEELIAAMRLVAESVNAKREGVSQ